MSAADRAPPASPAPVPRRRRGRALAIALAVLLPVVALAAAIAALVSTEVGLRAALALAQRLAPVGIEVDDVRGALTREFGAERLRVTVGDTVVEVAGLRARLGDVGMRPWRFDFVSLAAQRVEVRVAASATSAGPPESIASPVAVSAARLSVDELDLDVGGAHLAARALDGEVSLGPDGYRVAGGRLQTAAIPVTFDGRLGGRRPFALDLHGDLRTALRDQPVHAQWRASGSLVDFTLAAEFGGAQAKGQATARVGTFDAPALKSLQADVDGVDLHAWLPGLPTTGLALRADLRPDATATALSGDVQLDNRGAGTIDAGRLPARRASARIVLSRDALRADALAVALTRGSVAGSLRARFGAAADWQAELQLDGVDPAAIHARARPLLIDGHAALRQQGGVGSVKAELRNRGATVVHASLDLSLSAQRVDIARAELALGAGSLRAAGTVGLSGERRVRLEGSVERFDPGLLLAGVDAVVSGGFGIDARLAPQAAGELHFALTDAHAFGRPLAGHGRVTLDAARQLEVDVELAVRSAHLSAHGGLGAPGRSLALALQAPAIDELLPGVRGGLTAEATAHGSWDAPAVDVRLAATNLAVGDQTLQQASASASYGGGGDGAVTLRLDATNHALRGNAALSLRSLSLAVDGTLAAHAITLRGTTVNARTLALAAQGGWAERRWRGTLRDAGVDGPLALKLLEPAALDVGADGFALGPARLSAAGARLDALRLAGGAAGLRTSGSFSGLRPQELLSRLGVASGVAAGPDREPLALQGRWQLDLGARADGTLRVERSGGDLYAGPDADNALRLRELWLEAALDASRLTARVVAASERGGAANARLSAEVEHDSTAGWRLAQRRPWQVDADAEVPSLARANAVLGELLGANVRVDGRAAARVSIGGTPAEMKAQGSLTGDALRVAWIEQGMRLQNGRLRARLDGDRLWLDELRFAGPPHGRPKDARAASRVDFAQDGTVAASGQLRLRDAEGTIQVTAQHLPLLQRPDRWVVASGSAAIDASLEQAQLKGDFTADAGFVEATRSGLPSLSSDVVVARTGADPAARPSRFVLGFDIGVDLGPAFYVKGAGVDARAEGSLRLRSAGRGAVTATGTIEANDGRYDGFGQRLAIRRGRVNFQGSPENPGLDILAVREGLPVDVGVTVTRSVRDPLVRLYSDPPMADPETMSWLLFGHAGEQTRADNLALLQTAVGALAGDEQGVAGRFAQSLGIDEVTLRSGDVRGAGSLLPQSSVAGDLRGDRTSTANASNEILSIGKRVNDALTISYEQALSGTASVVQVAYRLSQRLYFVARAGTETAFDLVYSWAFD